MIHRATKYLGAIFILTVMLISGQSAWAACTAPVGDAGDVVYNSTEKTFQYCNDTNWIALNQPGSGAGGCANPATNEGDLVYNEDHRVLQGCAGNVHKAMGPVEGGDEWVIISTGGSHTCGIKTDGTGWCWGAGHWSSGTYGKIGHGSTGETSTPTKVSTTGVTGSRWIHISAGEDHSCGVRDNNTGWCWGRASEGRLGNSSISPDRTTPFAVSGGHSWSMISAGTAGFSCGVRTDGAGYCWGLNTNGRMGIGGSLGSTFSTPQAIVDGHTWKMISSGDNHACGIDSNDDAWCWGAQGTGKLGDGTSGVGSTTSPSAVLGGHKWRTLDAASNHTCGIATSGFGYCWGENGSHQLGDDTNTDRTSPTPITAPGAQWIDIATFNDGTCGIQTTGNAYCWGWGYWGELGDYIWIQDQPAPIYGSNTWRAISASGDNSSICATRTQGDLFCWGKAAGSGASHGTPFGNNTSNHSRIPSKVLSDENWLSVTTGGGHSCGVKTDNTGWCWGSVANGKLGLVNPYNSHHQTIPRPVSGGYSWSYIGAGDAHTCGIQTDGTGWCWGINNGGQVGDNTTNQRHSPVAINLAVNSVTGTAWTMIDLGSSGTNCGIRDDNTAWCWGWGSDGRLGDGDTANNLAPNIVSGGYSWSNISTGAGHSCGVQTNGTGWCWGSNGNGRLGDNGGAAAQQTTPFQISGGYSWLKISAGSQHSCGIRTDGVMMCWGNGGSGRLGTGNSTSVNVPTAVSGSDTWVDVHTGGTHSCGIKTDGTIWCWGSAASGSLGNNQVSGSFNTPQPLSGRGKWISLSGTDPSNCAVNVNGEAWCWGDGGAGALGNGYTGLSNLPSSAWCAEPDGKPGAIVYNSTEAVLQYCDGVSWVGAGGPGAKKVVLPSNGLVGYWQFNSSSGTTVLDSSGNNNHGTMTNMDGGTDWVTGRFGNGLDFDGTDEYVNVGNPAVLNDLFTRTVCAWVYPRAGGAGSYKHIVYKYDNPAQTGWDMYYGGSAQSQGGVGFIEPGGQVTNDQWQHFCVTSDGVNLEGYKNGVNTTPGGNDGGWGSAGSDAAYNLIIGGGTGSDAGDPFNGIIDELRIYNRVLTPEEIQALANQ